MVSSSAHINLANKNKKSKSASNNQGETSATPTTTTPVVTPSSEIATVPASTTVPSRAMATSTVTIDGHTLTAAEKELLDILDEVNGQDAYSNEDAALGRLRVNEYLVLPTGFNVPVVADKDVGSANVHTLFTKKDLADIYVLNKDAAPPGEDAVRFGLLRMEAVKMGWVDNQKEIHRKAAPAGSITTFLADLANEKDNIRRYRTAAFLIPLAAEHTFRTMGHHYLTAEAAVYEARYSSTFRSCLAPDIANLFKGGVLYHNLFHWVSPSRARKVLMAQLGTARIPEALQLRANAAPAGTAIITTSAAVLSAMAASNIKDPFSKEGGYDFKKIEDMTMKIKADPVKWHKTYYAYEKAPLTQSEKDALDEAKAEAAKFAPIAQAFIDAMFRDAALGKAKALKKHAEENPVLMRRAERFFRGLARKEAAKVAELYVAEVN